MGTHLGKKMMTNNLIYIYTYGVYVRRKGQWDHWNDGTMGSNGIFGVNSVYNSSVRMQCNGMVWYGTSTWYRMYLYIYIYIMGCTYMKYIYIYIYIHCL